MKLQRIVIRKARKMFAHIPNARTGEQYLLFRVKDRKVIESRVFTAHAVSDTLCIHGFTHYALIPTYVSP